MTASLAGITVSRTIPDKTLVGLALGRYTLHGGVVRWAADTPQAGQIVAHLLPAAGSTGSLLTGAGILAGAVNIVASISAVVGAGFGIATWLQGRQILKAVRQTMLVAELNLAATWAGFAALDARLGQIELLLHTVKHSLTSIQQLLEATQRAELRVALEHLEKLPIIQDERVRIELLTHSAAILGKLRRVASEQMSQANNVPDGLAAEEYFLVAALGQVRCYAELREPAMARSILRDAVGEWRIWARTFARTRLIGSRPERFLYGDLAPSAPLALMAAWLDFAEGTQVGMEAVEALRAKVEPWYYHRSPEGEPRDLRRSDVLAARDRQLAHDREQLIPALNKLVARHAVLESYKAQYALLEEYRLTPGEFEETILALAPPPTDEDERILVLTPVREHVPAGG